MKVLVVTQYFWPENFKINDLVSGLVDRGHAVTVLTGFPNYPDGEIYPAFLDNPSHYACYRGAKIIRAPLISRGGSRFRLTLNYLSFAFAASFYGLWRLKNQRFDVIFTNQLSPVTVAIPAICLRFFKGIPMVLWVQDLWPESLQATGVVKSPKLVASVGVLVAFIYRFSDLILVQSKSFISHIHKYVGSKVEVVYFPNWAESAYDDGSLVLAPEVPLKPESFDVMFAGNIGEAQDFPAILAAAEILRTHSLVRWLIVGAGRMSIWISKEIEARGLQQSVLMLGSYPIERMPSFFRHAKVMLVSLKNEPIFSMTIPSKLQTYLAAGKPIVGMINGESETIIKESGSGVVCSAGDASSLAQLVLRLSTIDSEELRLMGVAGKDYSKLEFDREILLSRLELMLEMLRSTRPIT